MAHEMQVTETPSGWRAECPPCGWISAGDYPTKAQAREEGGKHAARPVVVGPGESKTGWLLYSIHFEEKPARCFVPVGVFGSKELAEEEMCRCYVEDTESDIVDYNAERAVDEPGADFYEALTDGVEGRHGYLYQVDEVDLELK